MTELEKLGITLNELKKLVDDQIALGNGDKHILISDDDEGNGFHTLFYGFLTKQNGAKYLKEVLEWEHDNSHTVDNCVILG